MPTLTVKRGKTQVLGFYVRKKANSQAKDLSADTITFKIQDADTYATYITKTSGSGILQGIDGKGTVTLSKTDLTNLDLGTYHYDFTILDADTNDTEPGSSGDLVLEA